MHSEIANLAENKLLQLKMCVNAMVTSAKYQALCNIEVIL